MITLQVADLVIIAARVLDQDDDAVLDQLDLQAAEAALTGSAEAAAGRDDLATDLARAAAALLHALLQRPLLPAGSRQLALMATAQFLALNGVDLDLEPPEATARIAAELAAGRLSAAGLAGWLAPRLSPRADARPPQGGSCADTKEPTLLRWLQSRRRRGTDPFRRFTDRARMVMVLAQRQARRLGHEYIGTEHLLLGLIDENDGIAAKALRTMGITGDDVRHRVEEIIGRGTKTPAGHIPFTPRAKKVIEGCAKREAMQLGHNYIGTEHLLLGLIDEGEGVAAQVLIGLGAHHGATRKQVARILAVERDADPPAAPAGRPYLDDALGQLRRSKEAAIDSGDFNTAAVLRDAEIQLLFDKHRHGAGPDDGPPQAAHG